MACNSLPYQSNTPVPSFTDLHEVAKAAHSSKRATDRKKRKWKRIGSSGIISGRNRGLGLAMDDDLSKHSWAMPGASSFRLGDRSRRVRKLPNGGNNSSSSSGSRGRRSAGIANRLSSMMTMANNATARKRRSSVEALDPAGELVHGWNCRDCIADILEWEATQNGGGGDGEDDNTSESDVTDEETRIDVDSADDEEEEGSQDMVDWVREEFDDILEYGGCRDSFVLSQTTDDYEMI